LDDGDSPKHVSVVRECLLNTLEEEQINVVYDLEMPREQVLNEAHGPLLERFREDRVVGVSELLRVSRRQPSNTAADTNSPSTSQSSRPRPNRAPRGRAGCAAARQRRESGGYH